MMKVTAKQFLGITLMPRILPQIRTLFGSGFGHVAFYIAQIFAAARLLPANHPYLNYQNMGRYGVVLVLLEASRNLRFTRNNIDQITIFALVLVGGSLLLAQLFLLGMSLFMHTAHAAIPFSLANFFITPIPDNDIAFVLLDRVFGVPGLYNSCVATGALPCLNSNVVEGPFPFPYHTAFQDMLMFYSIGVAVIGLLIFMYYIVAIAVETAQTGTPFGRRFNHVWAPIRMVVALALLIPMSMGFNGAQMLTLYMAKWGSSLATNGWSEFVNVLVTASAPQALLATYDTTGAVVNTRLVADPQKPKPNELLRYYTVLATCYQIYKLKKNITIEAYLVRNTGAPLYTTLLANNWAAALAFFNNGPVVIVFGEQNNTLHSGYPGAIRPYCGKITFSPTDLTETASVTLQSGYYEAFIRDPWRNIDQTVALALTPPAAPPPLPAPSGQPQAFFYDAATNIIGLGAVANSPNSMAPNDYARNHILGWWDDRLTTIISTAVAAMLADPDWLLALNDLGWGGAAIWYNKIAQLNGALISGVSNLPTVTAWPEVMEFVSEEKSKKDKNILAATAYLPYLSDGKRINFDDAADGPIAEVLNDAYTVWHALFYTEYNGVSGATNVASSKNIFVDIVNGFFGTQGLYNMRTNTDVHPLAQLVTMGKYLLTTAIRNLAIGAGGSALAAPLTQMLTASDVPPVVIKAIAGMFTTIGMMTISIGFILYYVIPFMPFIYFFFQVGGWVKAVFEAMVGLPLWALAHIRIDGNGLPGDVAMSGYFLIFEIFLRPILTIFGLVGAISIFAAQVQVLNSIFELVVSNVTGFDTAGAAGVPTREVGAMAFVRGGIDQLFYTVIYVIIVYMMAQASFKLIYLIPNNMLRWMGSSVDGFGEIAKDAPDHLISTVYGSSQVITGQIHGGTKAALDQMGSKGKG